MLPKFLLAASRTSKNNIILFSVYGLTLQKEELGLGWAGILWPVRAMCWCFSGHKGHSFWPITIFYGLLANLLLQVTAG